MYYCIVLRSYHIYLFIHLFMYSFIYIFIHLLIYLCILKISLFCYSDCALNKNITISFSIILFLLKKYRYSTSLFHFLFFLRYLYWLYIYFFFFFILFFYVSVFVVLIVLFIICLFLIIKFIKSMIDCFYLLKKIYIYK